MNYIQWLIGACLAMLLSACASPAGITTHAVIFSPANQPGDAFVFPQQHWWEKFADTKLNELILQAIANNPDLKIAQSRITGAQAQEAETGSARYPQLAASAQSTREHLSANSIYPPPLGGSTVSMNALSIAGQWQIDWFGKQKASLEAAIGFTHAAVADRQAANVLLATSVATQYFKLACLQSLQQLKIVLQKNNEQRLELIKQRVAAGLENTIMLRQTRSDAAVLRRELAKLTEQIASSHHALASLAGAEPAAMDQLTALLPRKMDNQIPAVIPAQLLGHRADVAAARWRVESALKTVQVMRADFYPDLNIAAFAGLESIGLSQWLHSGSRLTGMGPALNLPVFDAGRLRARLTGQAAIADAAIESYNATVLNALREVADNVNMMQALNAQLNRQQEVVSELSGVQDLAEAKFKAGLVNYTNVLQAKDARLSQQGILLDLQAQTAYADVALMQSLGGGYASSDKNAEGNYNE